MLSEYGCVYCGRISMIQKGVPASRVGRFECNEGFRKIRFQESRLVPGPSKGCQMVLRGVNSINSPSLRVYLAPLGRCWSVLKMF